MADALVTPAVAGAAAAVAAGLLALAVRKLRGREGDSTDDLVPLMGVMGAFVFAAQMVNFTIPGTGSSGHIVGGILLAALLGPWAALLVLTSVLAVQCLVFSDGGLMALGCNIVNMGVVSTLVAYPLVYRPIAGNGKRAWRIVAGAVAASVAAMEMGAALVTAETALSGISALPARPMLALMLSVHLLIGLGEGVATAALLCFVRRWRPGLLADWRRLPAHSGGGFFKAAYVVMGAAVAVGAAAAWVAAAQPDGLQWTIERLAGPGGLAAADNAAARLLAGLQSKASLLPDYGSSWAGIAGCGAVLLTVWLGCTIATRHNRRKRHVHDCAD